MDARKYQALQGIHQILQPKRYLEVGVGSGTSWALVAENSASIGIDPAPNVTHMPPGKASLFEGTSDTFLTRYNAKSILGGPLDLALMDGMHLFDYAMRDFSNIERCSKPNGFILIDGCLPMDKQSCDRFRDQKSWTGDVWKIILVLKEYRPELHISTLDTGSGGLAVISNLQPGNDAWCRRLPEVTARFLQLPYEFLGNQQTQHQLLNVCDDSYETLERIFGATANSAEALPSNRSALLPDAVAHAALRQMDPENGLRSYHKSMSPQPS